MKNLLSREEYLEKVNEGFFRDTIKRGVDKVKSLFKIGMKKIKNFITIFDNEGNVLPVVSLQAVADNFSDVDGINVYVPDEINKSIIDAGGKGCETKATLISNDEVDDFGPKGKEFAIWMDEEKYKETIEYKNLMSIPGIIKEHYGCSSDEAKEIFEGMINETWEDIKRERISYRGNGKDSESLKLISNFNTKEFGDFLDNMIYGRLHYKNNRSRADGKTLTPIRNLLVFGAPGIGKSTVPKMVIDRYNKKTRSDEKKISLISINCGLIGDGDFMMPSMPDVKDVLGIIRNNKNIFQDENDYLNKSSEDEIKKIKANLNNTQQKTTTFVPPIWLPSYAETGDPNTDKLLDACANGGVYKDKTGTTHTTGSGGIILLDEFLRAPSIVFKQLMNFLLDRSMNQWVLGSDWSIIACTNRACDDDDVYESWNKWNGSGANKDRFVSMIYLEPNPEEWKSWARSKGCDEILLKFIFEETTSDDEETQEYPRWHSILTNSDEQVIPITPRRWKDAFDAINTYEIRNKKSIYEMEISEIRSCIGTYFDKPFVDKICNWLKTNMDSVSLDEIINSKNPQLVPFPAESRKKKVPAENGKKKESIDADKAVDILKNLFEQFKNKYKEPKKCPDEELAKIIIWIGKYYKDYFNIAYSEFINKVELYLSGCGYDLHDHKDTMQLIYTAWPPRDLFTTSIKEDLKFGEGSIWVKYKDNYEARVMELIKTYFPWRLKGNKIVYCDDLDLLTDDDEEDKED